MTQRYEVQTRTFFDGWVNCWLTTDEAGKEVPIIYATEAEAQAGIKEFLDDIAAEIASGERGPDDGYSEDEFQVVAVEN